MDNNIYLNDIVYDADGAIIGSEGFFADIMAVLASELNFTTVTRTAGEWGNRLENGTWYRIIWPIRNHAKILPPSKTPVYYK